jgi:hypothetical protein
MGWDPDRDDPSKERDSDAALRSMLLIAGWILMLGGLVWVWMVFFTKQAEIGLWIASGIFGLGFFLRRAGNQSP